MAIDDRIQKLRALVLLNQICQARVPIAFQSKPQGEECEWDFGSFN